MNVYRTALVLLVVSVMITACGLASTIPVKPTWTPCEAAVSEAIAATHRNDAFSQVEYGKGALAGIVLDPNWNAASKAGIINGEAYLAHRPLSDAIAMAEACGIAPPLRNMASEQLYQQYGFLYYTVNGEGGVFPGEVNVHSVMGGFPEKDYGVRIMKVRNGGTVSVFGRNYTFTYKGLRKPDDAYPVLLRDYDITYFDETGWPTIMFMWSKDGKVIFTTRQASGEGDPNLMAVVQVQ